MLPLKLLAYHRWPVIFYDQCGCGGSANIADPAKAHDNQAHCPGHISSASRHSGTNFNPFPCLQDAPWLLTIPYYVEECAAIVHCLKLDAYYLYGSSWGSCLAQEVAVTQPAGLAGIILDGALADGETYITTQWRDRISTLPTYTQQLLRQLEDGQAHQSATYKEIEGVLTSHFTTRLVPKPQCWQACLDGENKAIYTLMQGPSEFTLLVLLLPYTDRG